jgi:hypothetical protein
MSKTAVEDTKTISMQFLKKHKYLQSGSRDGQITWTRSGMWGEHKSSVGIHVVIMDTMYLRIYYTQTDNHTQEKRDFDYKVQIITTPCNYGGVRYWFVCPLSNKTTGAPCNRRIGTLYKDGDWFGCRHCWNLTYEARNKNRRNKYYALFWVLDIEDKVHKMRAMIKRKTYKGKPTKKQMKLFKLYRHYDENEGTMDKLMNLL